MVLIIELIRFVETWKRVMEYSSLRENGVRNVGATGATRSEPKDAPAFRPALDPSLGGSY